MRSNVIIMREENAIRLPEGFRKLDDVKWAYQDRIGYIFRMDSQGMAMLKMRGNRIEELTVSDPSRKLSRMIIDLPQGVFAGKSVTCKL